MTALPKDAPLVVFALRSRPAMGLVDEDLHRMHHASRSLVFPLPAPLSVPKKAPLPWDERAADHGLGYREVRPLPNMREMNIVVPK